MAQEYFEPPIEFSLEGEARSVAWGDFDRDGKPDVVHTTRTDSISVRLGLGDGSFGPRCNYFTGSMSEGVAVGDLDRDGVPDLIVAVFNYYATGALVVLKGRGDGTFEPATILPLDIDPQLVVAGDVNEDGWLDLVIAVRHQPAGTMALQVLMNGSGGALIPFPEIGVGMPTQLTLGDLDCDGHLDLVMADYGDVSCGWVRVFRGHGNGLFDAPALVGANWGPATSVAVGDLNRDGWPDLVIGVGEHWHHIVDRIAYALNRGDGSFDPAIPLWVGRDYWPSVAVTDVNVDGRPDIVLTDWANLLEVAFGNGDGTFWGTHSLGGYSGWALAAADFDGDALPDLLVPSYNAGLVFRNRCTKTAGLGLFQPPASYPAPGAPDATAIADMNHDGKLDVAVTHRGGPGLPGQTVSVLLGDGAGGLCAPLDFATGSMPCAILAADFNRDGDLDLAVANQGGNSASVLLGDGLGGFAAAVDCVAGTAPSAIAAGDFDRDGVPDLVIANRDADNVSVLRGHGDGTFAPAADFPVGASPAGVVAGDFDRDGALDLAVANAAASSVSVLRGDGSGSFVPLTVLPAATEPWALVAADFERDGVLDLAVACPGEQKVRVLRGRGDGGFDLAADLLAGSGARAIAAGDFNVDGRADLAVTNSGDGTMLVFLGHGDGTFSAASDFAAGGSIAGIAVGDCDRNGTPDLVAVNEAERTVSILRNGSHPVPVAVEALVATSTGGRVHLTWRLAEETRLATNGIDVERAATAAGPFERRTQSALLPERQMQFAEDDVLPGTRSWYRLVLRGTDGSVAVAGPVEARSDDTIPAVLVLHAPNVPADGGPVRIGFALPAVGGPVQVAIYDTRGRQLWVAWVGPATPGEHVVTWDRCTADGVLAARGIYFVRLRAGTAVAVQKLALVRR